MAKSLNVIEYLCVRNLSSSLQHVQVDLKLLQQSRSSKINLPDENSCHVEQMLRFLYRQTYTGGEQDKLRDLYHHASLYGLGDKYGIPPLCKYAATRFHDAIQSTSDATAILNCVRAVYGSTPDSNRVLRDRVISEITQRSSAVATNESSNKLLLRLIQDVDQFREDLVQALLSRCATPPDQDKVEKGVQTTDSEAARSTQFPDGGNQEKKRRLE
ncbi:MAG: hypothetical protein Q9216_006564 [Gyalolechia sp. 2 TL-2023]